MPQGHDLGVGGRVSQLDNAAGALSDDLAAADRGGRSGRLHLHDLRHAFATFLLDQGEELRTVMELLGHSTIRMTADTYGHVLPARARQAASAIDRVLGPRSAKGNAGGAQGTRTPNPCLAKAVLCQLS